MKKLILVCVVAIVFLRAFCSTETIDGITWKYSVVDGKAYLGNDKGSLYGSPGISNKTSGDVVVPQKVGGYSVIGLCEGMFYGCSLITNVQVPIGVESIGTRAFYKCLSLENISLPEGLLSIGYGAFDHCSSLRSITIPSTVTNLDVTAFENCDSLTNIVCLGKISLRESSYSGYSYNWWGCTNLLSAIVRDVDYATFYGCDKLSQVTFLEGAKIIRNDAFKGCSSLAKICFPEGLPLRSRPHRSRGMHILRPERINRYSLTKSRSPAKPRVTLMVETIRLMRKILILKTVRMKRLKMRSSLRLT